MNLLEWDFSSLEFQLDSSSGSETIEKVCVEDLHCPSPTASCQSASSLHYVNQESHNNLLVNDSVSANSSIDQPVPKIVDVDNDSIPQSASLFKFTREALQKRLHNLVNRSLKNFIDDPEVTAKYHTTSKAKWFVLDFKFRVHKKNIVSKLTQSNFFTKVFYAQKHRWRWCSKVCESFCNPFHNLCNISRLIHS